MGSLIQCPHCIGSGFRWPCSDSTEQCPTCGNNNIAGPDFGVLELPLSPEHADAIYDAGCACCEQLVHQAWDQRDDGCFYGECQHEWMCRHCEAFQVSP